jgi:hypothetical protein
VDVAHGLGDGRVPHPRHEAPGIHSEHRSVRPEGVTEVMPAFEREPRTFADSPSGVTDRSSECRRGFGSRSRRGRHRVLSTQR